MIVPDTNLLVYAHHPDAQLHSPAKRWWQALLDGNELIGLPWIVTTGFIRVSTNVRMLEQPTTTEVAVRVANDWFRYPHVFPLNPGSRHMVFLSEALAAVRIGGNLVPDAHIAALAIEYQAEVHSSDSDFARFPGLRWKNPLDESR